MIASSALRCSLRLVEKTRVLERDAHAVGQGLQQPQVRLAEGVLALHVRKRNRASNLIADDQGNEDNGLLHFGTG
jgi:hypothetical protein